MFGFKRNPGRTGLRAALLSGATVAAIGLGGLGAGSAMAAQCGGSAIHGQGSSLQNNAQQIWVGTAGGIGFNSSSNAKACNGSQGTTGKPGVTYVPSSSGTGMHQWGYDDGTTFNTGEQFIGTDDAPNAGQIANIKAATKGEGVLTVPIAQAAVAVVVHLPANCELRERSISSEELEKVFNGRRRNWSDIPNAMGTGCGSHITRVVRADNSGTTYQFKHFLFAQNEGALDCLTAPNNTWAKLQTLSTTWPEGECSGGSTKLSRIIRSKAGGVGPGAGSGGGDEVKTVKNTEGSIGYANLADARGQFNATTLTWVKVDGQEPADAAPSATKGKANCSTGVEKYLSEETGLVPAGEVDESWSDVYSFAAGGKYPICVLTYDLALHHYKAAFGAMTGEGFAQTVQDYLGYVVDNAANGGQPQALETNNDYAPLPTDVRTSAVAAVARIKP